jgi:hypothetical protein
MRVRSRKLIGTIVLLLLLAVYATLAVVIGSGRIAQAPQWVQFAFFLTAGLALGHSGRAPHALDAAARLRVRARL